MPQRTTMIRYLIPLLMLSVFSTADTSNTAVKSQFTVTYIMLERLHEEDGDKNIPLEPDDSNATRNTGGEKR